MPSLPFPLKTGPARYVASGGKLLTSLGPNFTTIEDWESYSSGTVINSIDEWNGATTFTVTTQGDVQGDQEGGYVIDEPWYDGVLSLTTAGTGDQSATYAAYPEPDMTFRAGYKHTSGHSDVARLFFCVPDGETPPPDNGYLFQSTPGSDFRIRKIVAGSLDTVFTLNTAASAGTVYDVAIEVEANASDVGLGLSVYEWDGSSWSLTDSGAGTDSANEFPNEGGIGFAGIAGDTSATDGFVFDNLRFIDELEQAGTPSWTP